MIKLLIFITAKPDISREDFIHYYETHHVPLARRLLPMIGEYRRNFLAESLRQPEVARPDFDVVTELCFDDEAAFKAFRETTARPEVLAAIRADEANFLDSTKTRTIRVDEHIAPRNAA